MSFSAGEPGIAQKEKSSDDERHRHRPRKISSLPMAFGFFRPAGTLIGLGWVTIPFESSGPLEGTQGLRRSSAHRVFGSVTRTSREESDGSFSECPTIRSEGPCHMRA